MQQASFRQGVALLQQGRYAEAAAQFEQAIALEPRHFDALHLAGVAAQQLGQLERSSKLLARALEIGRAHV